MVLKALKVDAGKRFYVVEGADAYNPDVAFKDLPVLPESRILYSDVLNVRGPNMVTWCSASLKASLLSLSERIWRRKDIFMIRVV